MSISKSISYLLCNKGIIVNLYKLHFLSFHFSFQLNKIIFHLPTFPSLQPNTHKGKLNIFYSPTFPLLQPNGPLSVFAKYLEEWVMQATSCNSHYEAKIVIFNMFEIKLVDCWVMNKSSFVHIATKFATLLYFQILKFNNILCFEIPKFCHAKLLET